ncbi:RagB/SusD family nutrient uptake outer membrane protein [uncultured Kriegella sp.]|uniref:RagB/SusD family nutrient uptake outer membrane protein n=1 Tax=uncultured Kriegella sp. TaxID=1798910 RepID=UPI0030D6F4CE|tara:strand:+ start:50553 stop:52274 length:1722 start_codon:yes stop_codon:yes gene_type:complete
MKKVALYIFVTILIMSSCSDEYLESTDYDSATLVEFPNDPASLELVAANIYSNINDYNLYGFDYLTGVIFPADHSVDFGWKQERNWQEAASHRWTPQNAYLTEAWQGFYKIIGSTNVLLRACDNLEASEFTAEDNAAINEYRAEALFWRGWAHHQLVQLFGEGYPANGDGEKRGVIIHTEVATNSELQYLPRSTVNEVYAQILSDYKEAEKILPTSRSGTAVAKPTKFTAQAFIGQLQLGNGNYQESATILKNVIDNSAKSLLPYEEYSKLFNEDQIEFSDESLLELSVKNRPGSWGVWGGSEGTMHSLKIAPFVGHLDTDENDIPIPDGDGDYIVTGTQETGWCNLFLHDRNIERFGTDPRLKIVAMEPATLITKTVDGNVVEAGTNVRPDQFIYGKELLLPYAGTKGYEDDMGNSIKGWSIRKYVPLEKNLYDWEVSTGINIHFMRLADVYLMYAEASLKVGQEDVAREYINKVRRRAYNVFDQSQDITSTGEELFEDLKEERFKEFCAEGAQNWFDYCRWKSLEDVVNKWYTYTLITPGVKISVNPNSYYAPIPLVEIESNSNCEQSTGY